MTDEQKVRSFPEEQRKTLWEGKISLKEEVARKIQEDEEDAEKKLDFLVTKKPGRKSQASAL